MGVRILFVPLKTIDSLLRLPLYGKVILIRGDANFSLDENGRATDLTKIEVMKKTIDRLLAAGAKVVLLSHNGRPRGKGFEHKYSLVSTSRDFEDVLGRKVTTTSNCIGKKRDSAIKLSEPGSFMVCENVRFHAGEQSKDKEVAESFAKELLNCVDYYVNEAFSVSHRADTSVVTVCEVLGLEKCFVGYTFAEEYKKLSEIRNNIAKDLTIVLGGAKIDKIETITGLLGRAKKVIFGGALANTFLEAKKIAIGGSLSETDNLDQARKILEFAKENGVEVFIPSDAIVINSNGVVTEKTISDDASWINADEKIVDIGTESRATFIKALADSKDNMIFWNGPLGFIENTNFRQGTYEIAKHLANFVNASIVFGGGDTASALAMFKDLTILIDKNDYCHVSTSGGAALDFLKLGNEMPGVEVNLRAAKIIAA